jgi:site-specific recombinase XerD
MVKAPEQSYSSILLKKAIKEMKDLRTQALASTLYVTGARISEICQQVKVGQIEVTEYKKVPLYLFNGLKVLKRRKEMRRNVPVSPEDNDLMEYILQYIDGKKSKEYVFDFKRWTGWKIMRDAFGKKEAGRFERPLWPHFWRHMAATNKVLEQDFDSILLTKFMSWANIRQTERYVNLKTEDIQNKLIQNWKKKQEEK